MNVETAEPLARPAPEASTARPEGDGPTVWLIAPLVALAAFMEVLDISIANVSLQHIAGSLSASRDESTWILTSYLVTNAIVLPISGWLSTILGRKRFYLTCILGFGASSLMCGLAGNLYLLILFRGLQGMTGGGLQPTSQAILADSFAPHQRSMAFALYGVAVVFAPAIGPTLGGWITDNYSWHWVFLINVPVSIVLFVLIRAMIDDPPHQVAEREARRQRGIDVDYLGFALLALALGSLQIVLDKGQEDDWFSSDFIVTCAVLAACGLIVFVWRELHRHDPIVDLGLLRDRGFATANGLMFMLGFILFGSTALLPLFTQGVLGYTATLAGEVISPGGFAIMLLMPVVGKLMSRVDARVLIAFGLALTAFALYRMSKFNVEIDYWTVALDRIIQTCGIAFLFIPINTVAYSGLPANKNNAASSLINLARNLGGSVGIAVLTTILTRQTQAHRAFLVQNIAAADPEYRHILGGLQERMLLHGGDAAQATLKAQAVIAQQVEHQAQVLAYGDVFLFMGSLFVLLIPLVLLLKKPSASGEMVAH